MVSKGIPSPPWRALGGDSEGVVKGSGVVAEGGSEGWEGIGRGLGSHNHHSHHVSHNRQWSLCQLSVVRQMDYFQIDSCQSTLRLLLAIVNPVFRNRAIYKLTIAIICIFVNCQSVNCQWVAERARRGREGDSDGDSVRIIMITCMMKAIITIANGQLIICHVRQIDN